MQIMKVQQYSMAETPVGTAPVTDPAFGMAKKISREVTKKGKGIVASLLTAGAAALTGQVLVNKSKRPTVKEITNESIDILNEELPSMTKKELEALDARSDATLAKCDKFLKNSSSSTVKMYKEFLTENRFEIKEQIASTINSDIQDFFDNKIGYKDEGNHIDYENLSKDELDALDKQITEFLDDCDKYGNERKSLRSTFDEYRKNLKQEKDAIKYIPKFKDMSFDELYSLYNASGTVLDDAVSHYMFNEYYIEYNQKMVEIEKICSSYERGLMNYNMASGNKKNIIKTEMICRYGRRFLDDIRR